MVDYANLILSILSPNTLKTLEVLQNKTMRIILGWSLTTKVLVMRKELDVPSYLEWKAKAAPTIVSFIVWNTEATNFLEAKHTAL